MEFIFCPVKFDLNHNAVVLEGLLEGLEHF